jgi:hypothetical protein
MRRQNQLPELLPEELQYIHGGMFTAGVLRKVFFTSTKSGLSAVTEMPAHQERMRAEAEAKEQAALASFKASNPELFKEIFQPDLWKVVPGSLTIQPPGPQLRRAQ